MGGNDTDSRINPFVSNLSFLNALISFSIAIFSYTIIYTLSYYHKSILLAGFGISAGEALTLAFLIPIGSLIDRGHSFRLMMLGAILYGAFLASLYFTISLSQLAFLAFLVVPALIASLILFQNVFKSSLNSFIAKAISNNLLGQNYARILTMETIGTAVAFGVFAAAAYYSFISWIYLWPGVFTVGFSLLVFMFLAGSQRKKVLEQEAKVRRPTIRESFRHLGKIKNFVIPLITSKLFMLVGIIATTFFYIPTAVYLSISPTIGAIALLIAYILGALWGKAGEMILRRWSNLGRLFVTLATAIDVVTFAVIVFSIEHHLAGLFIAAILISSPGPLLISGALSYEVEVIGKENRGMFGAVQRLIVASVYIFLGASLTFVFTKSFALLWIVALVASAGSFYATLVLPWKSGSAKEHLQAI